MAKRTNLRLVLAAALLAGYWCALFVATHVPLPDGLPGAGLDKLYHAAAYAGLALLLSTVWSLRRPTSWKSYVLVVLLIAAYGALDEWIQMHVPGRSAELLDWTADLLGAVAGAALHWVCAAVIGSRSGSVPTAMPAEDKEQAETLLHHDRLR